ncbi:MAG: sigma 54-interacting transcriptional regulator [Desulfovibrio sp.]|jgi:transcriptional regulator with PAS, ATPase and Fis domain|nr:sigma 54-interacting transcriptional regulator [Desulfovibrio sp.]
MESGKEELYQKAPLLSAKANNRILVNRIPVRNPQGIVIGFMSQLMSVGDQGWGDIWRKIEYAEQALRGLPASFQLSETQDSTQHGIVSVSPLIKTCIEKAWAYAETDEPILISGPTGVGKELFARAIQQASNRAERAFVCVNCASISKEFINSELFGYAPGAFTGAQRQGKQGLMEMADKGTLFLDEIGDLPFEAQGVLLRVLETHEVQRINALNAKEIDFRLISATNKNLWEMCRNSLFREDLFFRLSALPLNIPPLAERTEDIPLLAKYFLGKIRGGPPDIEDSAMDLLLSYSWPGNVRELRNVLTYASITAKYGKICTVHLTSNILDATLTKVATKYINTSQPPITLKIRSLKAIERDAINATMRHCGGNLTRAAQLLDISRATLYAKLKRYASSYK